MSDDKELWVWLHNKWYQSWKKLSPEQKKHIIKVTTPLKADAVWIDEVLDGTFSKKVSKGGKE